MVAAIRIVRALARRPDGDYDMRAVMASFVGKLSFRDMCVVLKEQKGWRQVRDFFSWMKLQVGFCTCLNSSLSLSLLCRNFLPFVPFG